MVGFAAEGVARLDRRLDVRPDGLGPGREVEEEMRRRGAWCTFHYSRTDSPL